MNIELYSGPFCAYCVMAKQLLKRMGLNYREYNVRADSAKLEEMLSRSGGARTIPQVFINGRHVGGYDDLSALFRSGKLSDWLENDNKQA